MAENLGHGTTSPQELIIQSREQLNDARAEYARAYAQKNNGAPTLFEHDFRWAPGFLKGVDPEKIKDEQFVAIKNAYAAARREYLSHVATHQGANARESSESSEKWRVWMERFNNPLDKTVAGVGAVVVISHFIFVGLGTYRFLSSLGISSLFGSVLYWIGDTTNTKKAKKLLEDEWTKAKEAGESYETFRSKNVSKVKSVSRNLLWDRVVKGGGIAGLGFATFTLPGFRGLAYRSVASAGDDILGNNWGTFFVKGHDLVGKFAKMSMAALAAVFDSVWHEMGIGYADAKPRADFIPVDQPTHPEKIEMRQRLPIFFDAGGRDTVNRSLLLVDRTIEWARYVLRIYKSVMPSDWLNNGEMREMETALKELYKVRIVLADAVGSGRTSAVDAARLRENELVQGFRNNTKAFYQAAFKINSLPRYGYYMDGDVPRRIADMPYLKFKYSNYDRLPSSMGRALYEFYRDLFNRGPGNEGGLTIAEGHSLTDGATSRHSSNCHVTGQCVDMGPSAVDGDHPGHALSSSKLSDPLYIWKVLIMQLSNKHYTILFEPGDYDRGTAGVAQRKLIFDVLTKWEALGGMGMSQNDATKFLSTHSKSDSIRYIMYNWLINYQGMSRSRAQAFASADCGNHDNTNSPHFHVEAPDPIDSRVPLEPQADPRWSLSVPLN